MTTSSVKWVRLNGSLYGDYAKNSYRAREINMPRVHNFILDCVIYLYRSREEAEGGEDSGGTGFLVVSEFPDKSGGFVYAVTNSHVVRSAMGNAPVVRINTVDGGSDIIELTNGDWVCHPDGDDLAVADIPLDGTRHNLQSMIPIDMFASGDVVDELDIGIGDDVYFTGRLALSPGKQKNLPVLRFGHIARMPVEPMTDGRGLEQECYLIEAHSLSGFSGSPVFVYIPAMTPRPKQTVVSAVSHTRLLGIDCGHIDWFNPIGKLENGKFAKKPGQKAKSNSGIMKVIPAWKLAELLEEPKLKAPRERAWEMEKKKRTEQAKKSEPRGEVVDDAIRGENRPDDGRERFDDLLKRAAKPKK